jgi:hypothetical protein
MITGVEDGTATKVVGKKKRGRSRVKDWRHPSMKESLLANQSIAREMAMIDCVLRN